MTDTANDLVLGRVVQNPIERIQTLKLDRAPFEVLATANEVQALCPVTGQPDIYEVEIGYAVVDSRVIESKSLKLYLWKFRDRGISCEELAATIAAELTEQYGGLVAVHTKQNSRGGIVLEAQA